MTTRELDLDPRANVGTTQRRSTSLGAALRVGTHDHARVNAQLVQHQRHQRGVLLVVTDEVVVVGEHALEAVCAHAGARELRVLVEIEAVR